MARPIVRPIFIIGELEPGQALSVRKLVIETAKFNVITAHSVAEMLESAKRYPAVDAIIIHSDLDGNLPLLIKQVRDIVPDKPVIALTPNNSTASTADHTVSSHDPHELVELLREHFGDPREIDSK
ncbi:MAG TPA: hypothetical protein VMZ25_10975 [Terriglobales bacterium]|nr:hypothetical protein [Terriglobales bacterium]